MTKKCLKSQFLLFPFPNSLGRFSRVDFEYFVKKLRKSIDKLEITCLKGDERFLRDFAKHGKEIARKEDTGRKKGAGWGSESGGRRREQEVREKMIRRKI